VLLGVRNILKIFSLHDLLEKIIAIFDAISVTKDIALTAPSLYPSIIPIRKTKSVHISIEIP